MSGSKFKKDAKSIRRSFSRIVMNLYSRSKNRIRVFK